VRHWRYCKSSTTFSRAISVSGTLILPHYTFQASRGGFNLVGTGNHRNHGPGQRSFAKSRQIARASPASPRGSPILSENPSNSSVTRCPPSLRRRSLLRLRRGSKPRSRSHCERFLPPRGTIRSFCIGRLLRRRAPREEHSGWRRCPSTAGIDRDHAEVDCGNRTKRRRGPLRSGGCAFVRRSLRIRRPCRIGRRIRERLFRSPKHARQDGDGSRPLRR